MILKESEIDSDTIESVLGKPYKEPGKWFTVTGSSYYFIKELTTIDGEKCAGLARFKRNFPTL